MNNLSIGHVTWNEAAAELAAVRTAVFVREQEVPAELEMDDLDDGAKHVLARTAEGVPVGTGRLLADGHIGRLAVLRDFRGSGLGGRLLNALVEQAREDGLSRVYLDAQIHALGFYQRWGFVAEGAEFYEAGIPHQRMTRILSAAGENDYSPE